MEKGGHFVNMLIRPLRLGRFWPILYKTFFEVYLSQSNRETFCCNLFQVKCYISPAKSALREFKVSMNGICLKHDPHPVYLGVTLDRTLSFKEHTTKTADKLKSRNNLLSKLAGTSWGASANTLRTSALALCYSVAQYCCPVWSRSSHIRKVDS